jgi:hypothetical protein
VATMITSEGIILMPENVEAMHDDLLMEAMKPKPCSHRSCQGSLLRRESILKG